MAMRKPNGRNMRDADARAVAEVKRGVAKATGAGDEDDAGGSDDDDDDDGGSGGSDDIEVHDEPADDGDLDVGAPPQPTPREQRRRARQSLREEAEQMRERVARLEAEREELIRRTVAPPAQEPQRPAQTEPDPLVSDLRATRAEQQQLAQRWKSLTPAEQAAQHQTLLEKQQELLDKEDEIRYRINQKKFGGGGQSVSHEDVAAHARNAALQMQYPDVAAHGRAWGWACTIQRAEIDALGGRERLTQEQVDRITHTALQSARRRFNLGTAPTPTQQQRERFTGTSSGGGAPRRAPEQRGGGGGGGPTFKVSRTSREGKMMVKMAVSAYPHIARKQGEEAAVRHWMKEAGPGVARELAKGGKG